MKTPHSEMVGVSSSGSFNSSLGVSYVDNNPSETGALLNAVTLIDLGMFSDDDDPRTMLPLVEKQISRS